MQPSRMIGTTNIMISLVRTIMTLMIQMMTAAIVIVIQTEPPL